jgi:hypothetical protein
MTNEIATIVLQAINLITDFVHILGHQDKKSKYNELSLQAQL